MYFDTNLDGSWDYLTGTTRSVYPTGRAAQTTVMRSNRGILITDCKAETWMPDGFTANDNWVGFSFEKSCIPLGPLVGIKIYSVAPGTDDTEQTQFKTSGGSSAPLPNGTINPSPQPTSTSIPKPTSSPTPSPTPTSTSCPTFSGKTCLGPSGFSFIDPKAITVGKGGLQIRWGLFYENEEKFKFTVLEKRRGTNTYKTVASNISRPIVERKNLKPGVYDYLIRVTLRSGAVEQTNVTGRVK